MLFESSGRTIPSSTHRAPEPISNYLLYGKSPELGLVHVETVPVRARLHNVEVQPHRHGGLHHFSLITAGGGVLTVDGAQRRFCGGRGMPMNAG